MKVYCKNCKHFGATGGNCWKKTGEIKRNKYNNQVISYPKFIGFNCEKNNYGDCIYYDPTFTTIIKEYIFKRK